MYANQIINRFMDFDANRIIEQSLLNSDGIVFVFLLLSSYCVSGYIDRISNSTNLLASEIDAASVKQNAFIKKYICTPGFLSRTSVIIYKLSCEKNYYLR